MSEPTGQEILDVSMQPNDADASTIREYLAALAATVWYGGSSKRPFGNSNWEGELYEALVTAGFLEGTEDEWGFIQVSDVEAHKLIVKALRALGEKP